MDPEPSLDVPELLHSARGGSGLRMQGTTFEQIEDVALTEAGQVLFSALAGPQDTGHWGVWSVDRHGNTDIIAAEGKFLETASGDSRYVNRLGYPGGAWFQGAVNDRGQFAFRAEFLGGSEGIFIASLMKPLAADYNGNGTVEQGDVDLVLLNWGEDASTPPEAWTADLPSGVIDQEVLDGVLLNWGATASGAARGSMADAVPEPPAATLRLMSVVAAGVAYQHLQYPMRRQLQVR